MGADHTHDRPEYGKIRMDAQFATEDFEESDELDEAAVDRVADLESNELKAAGETCARCGRVIAAGSDVRRTVSGSYQHEVCPIA